MIIYAKEKKKHHFVIKPFHRKLEGSDGPRKGKGVQNPQIFKSAGVEPMVLQAHLFCIMEASISGYIKDI